MSFNRRLLMLLVFTLVVALAGFNGLAQDQAVKTPDTLIVQSFGDPKSLDPAWEYDTTSSAIGTGNIYEALVFLSGARRDLWEPMLATAVPSVANGGVSSDGKTYTFKIRQGVKFTDGNPLTAEDVKYSLMRIMLMDRDGGPSGLLLGPILGFDNPNTRDDKGNLIPDVWDRANRAIQVKGDSVAITLKEPYAPFLSILATWSVVHSKKFVVANGGWNGSKATLASLTNPPQTRATTPLDQNARHSP